MRYLVLCLAVSSLLFIKCSNAQNKQPMSNLSRQIWVGAAIVLLIAVYPVFAHLGYLPVRLFDESRLAMNAFEMHRSGEWLITTFDGEPDLWNTRPPLMIWLQVLCMKLNGLNELSIRIPSAISALATFFFLYWFSSVKLKRPLLGVLVCLVLITSPGYIGLHRTRTGDYDALLTFFTTAHCLFFYLYAEEKRQRFFYLSLLLLIGGIMTKGITAMIFLPAMVVYLICTKRMSYVLKQRDLYIGILAFALCITGYYLLREWRLQGYLDAVLYNDVTGRFGDSASPVGNDYLYYARNILTGSFSWWALLLPAALVYFVVTNGKTAKRPGMYALLLGLFFFIIVSISRTKEPWYDMPVYPMISLAVALFLAAVINRLANRAKYPWAVNALLVIAVFSIPYYRILEHVNSERSSQSENDSIAFFMKDILHNENRPRDFAVVWDGYHANLYWYIKILRHQGRGVKTAVYTELKPGMNIAAFQKSTRDYIQSHYNYEVTGQFKTVRLYRIMP